jgi:hypothetical protein
MDIKGNKLHNKICHMTIIMAKIYLLIDLHILSFNLFHFFYGLPLKLITSPLVSEILTLLFQISVFPLNVEAFFTQPLQVTFKCDFFQSHHLGYLVTQNFPTQSHLFLDAVFFVLMLILHHLQFLFDYFLKFLLAFRNKLSIFEYI